MFGCRIVTVERNTNQPNQRTDGNDLSGSLASHDGKHCLCHFNRTPEICFKLFVGLFYCCFFHAARKQPSGVIYQNINALELPASGDRYNSGSIGLRSRQEIII